MRPFSVQNPNIIQSLPNVPTQNQNFFKIKAQSQIKYPRRSLNQPISNKSNTQYELTLKQKNEITIKINKLSELITRDEPKIYYRESGVDFTKRDLDSINANLPLIDQKKLNAPIRTRQFLQSTYEETMNEIAGKDSNYSKTTPIGDPIELLIHENHSRFENVYFNNKQLTLTEDGLTVNEKPVQKKRPILELGPARMATNNLLPQIKKKHRYDIPLENSRTISAKEVLRMVDSSLISSDMEYSQNNSLNSTSMILNGETDTPSKSFPSYLKYFNNGNVLMDTPLKSNSTSTPTMLNRFTSLQDEEFRYSPLNGSKLRKL